MNGTPALLRRGSPSELGTKSLSSTRTPRERTQGTARDFAAAGLVVGALIGGEVAVALADALVVVALAGALVGEAVVVALVCGEGVVVALAGEVVVVALVIVASS